VGTPVLHFLEYLAPRDGRPFPADARANDLVHWQTTLIVRDLEATAQQIRAGMFPLVSPSIVTLTASQPGFTKGILVRDPRRSCDTTHHTSNTGSATMMHFGPEICHNLETALQHEWLETNGLCGFASPTILGLNTRRYHSLLTAATKPSVGRLVLLAKLEKTLVVDGRQDR
jgi:hypothetical protein